MSVIKTGGRWSRKEKHVYFLASSPHILSHAQEVSSTLLLAVNEILTPQDRTVLRELLDAGAKILLDSGVYSLTMAHARLHGMHMDKALKVPVKKLAGFDELYRQYVKLVLEYGGEVWGYIEIDAGGRDQKRKTRRRLEAEGLKPMPVYHPLNDGWDYFDELASEYDRICLGNIVQASTYMRTRLLATLAERMRDHPNLWVHVLGLTPSVLLNAYPMQSADSSAWLASVRWSGYVARTALKGMGQLPKNFQYQLGEKRTFTDGVRMGAYGAALAELNWRNHMGAMYD